jgi:hypothetical protein
MSDTSGKTGSLFDEFEEILPLHDFWWEFKDEATIRITGSDPSESFHGIWVM